MTPIDLFHEARLTDALEAQREIVRHELENIGECLLLCDLLAFVGERDTLKRQLELLERAPAPIQSYIAEWHELLAADEARHLNALPSFIIPPPPHAQRRLEALRQLHSQHFDEMLELIDDADEHAPCVEGYVDGRPFEGWRDSDDLIGPMLEIIARGEYLWIPMEHIRKLRLEDAEALRDHLFRPATLWLVDGSVREIFIPSLYVGTQNHSEEGIRTGVGVDWTENAGLMRGVGGRTFLIGDEELSLSEFKQIELRSN